jgi:hypothetical protein
MGTVYQYLLDKRLGGSFNLSRYDGKEKNPFPSNSMGKELEFKNLDLFDIK